MTKSLLTCGALVLLVAGCVPATGGTGPGPGPGPGPASGTPTYHQDVAPLLAASCNGCHAQGGIAPMALTTPEAAQQWAPAIAASTTARLMPPWMPGGSSPAMHGDPRLSDAQVELLRAWAEAGAPLGDAAHAAPLPPPVVVDIGTPELRVDTGHDYVPDGALRDDYRCFVVDLGLVDGRMATGLRITPGNRAAVHHVLVALYDGVDRQTLEAAQGKDGRPGYACFGNTQPPGVQLRTLLPGMLGAWAPGTSALRQPEGTGVPLGAGQVAVIQVHYNLAAPGASQPDRTRLEVALAPRGTEDTLRPTRTIPLVDQELHIPPGAVGHLEEVSQRASDWARGFFSVLFGSEGFDVLAVSGHMHLLGRHFLLTRTRAGQVTTLLEIPRWDFHWQNGYQLVQPIDIRADDVVTLRCVYDNTPQLRQEAGFTRPLSEVTWGEGTEDEMCLAFLQVARRAGR